MERMGITMKEVRRFEVLRDVERDEISLREGVEMMGISYRQGIRLKQRFKELGFEGIIRKTRDNYPNLKVTAGLNQQIVFLYEKDYWDFNIEHFREKLLEEHNINLCYETIRQILMKSGKHQPKQRKPKYRRRRRMPQSGMLLQMDTSEHKWLPCVDQRWCLIAVIDDATNKVSFAKFFERDTVYNNMEVIRKIIEIEGLFISLYADKASHFKTTRKGGLHYSVNQEQEDTQIERALEELGITLIPANSPQAKGRIERLFRTLQDRLVNEMRLAEIKDYDNANEFLINKFLPSHNNRFNIKAESVYKPLPSNINLDIIFSKQYVRTVNKDNTIQIMGHTIQLPPTSNKLSLAKHKVTVCISSNNEITVLYNNCEIKKDKLSEENETIKREQKIEEILNQREYLQEKKSKTKSTYIPPINHPWKKYSFQKNNGQKQQNITTPM